MSSAAGIYTDKLQVRPVPESIRLHHFFRQLHVEVCEDLVKLALVSRIAVCFLIALVEDSQIQAE